jgi:hypothetical protein
MVKTKRTMIYKTLHRKQKIDQHDGTPLKTGVNSGALEG